MGPRVDNNTELWLAKINRFQRLAAAYNGGSSGSGNFEFVAKFTVGGGGGAPTDGETEYANPAATGTIMVHKNGVGWLEEGVDFAAVVGGGFELLIGEFTTGEVYSVWKVLA